MASSRCSVKKLRPSRMLLTSWLSVYTPSMHAPMPPTDTGGTGTMRADATMAYSTAAMAT